MKRNIDEDKSFFSVFKKIKKENFEKQDLIMYKNYDPSNIDYCPSRDIFWGIGKPVPFSAFSQTLQLMEKTNKRLTRLSILTNFLRSVLLSSKDCFVPTIYLLSNKIAPDYEGIEMGIGENIIIKCMACSNKDKMKTIKRELNIIGDLGDLVMRKNSNSNGSWLTVTEVYNNFKEISLASGIFVMFLKRIIFCKLIIKFNFLFSHSVRKVK